MKFKFDNSIEILDRTPRVLIALIRDLNEEWINSNEGDNTWNIKEVVAHLIVCEETNCIQRTRIILSDRAERLLHPIDMTIQMEMAKTLSMEQLLVRFENERRKVLAALISMDLTEDQFVRTAIHPVIGEITLAQLMSTWVTHDMVHLAQIARIIAKQNKENVGPFKHYLTILNA